MSQTELAEALGSSRRTIIRRELGQSSPVDFELRQFADLVRLEDADLADEMLAAGGLQEPIAAPIAPAAPDEPVPAAITPALPAEYRIDAILCAAADAIDAVPRDVKPAIVAAFVRAKQMGLSIEEVVAALESAK